MSQNNELNVLNRTIFCRDNLEVMRGINSNCIDLIYLDPPFNKNKKFTAPIGTKAEGASFNDIFRKADVKDEWLFLIEHKYKDIFSLINAVKIISKSDYNWCYLTYMAVRLLECHRILKTTGSLYLHCDQTMSHYLKILLDCIFGERQFRNEIVWSYNKWTNAARYFQRNHDKILFYTKNQEYFFNKQYWMTKHKEDVHSRGWDTNKIDNQIRQLLVYDRQKARSEIQDPKYDKIVYLDDAPQGTALSDVWTDINYLSSNSKERTGYPTQKPLTLLERIIKTSSNKGDIVLDPFCGCATTCVAAETLERHWIGIDISPKAYQLVRDRLLKPRQLGFEGSAWKFVGDIVQRTDMPIRTDTSVRTQLSRDQMLRILFKEQNGKCGLCKTEFEERHFEIDHFYPKSLGGVDDIANRQLLCSSCNRIKGAKSMEEAIAIARRRQLITA